jgi:hypothetical protein
MSCLSSISRASLLYQPKGSLRRNFLRFASISATRGSGIWPGTLIKTSGASSKEGSSSVQDLPESVLLSSVLARLFGAWYSVPVALYTISPESELGRTWGQAAPCEVTRLKVVEGREFRSA